MAIEYGLASQQTVVEGSAGSALNKLKIPFAKANDLFVQPSLRQFSQKTDGSSPSTVDPQTETSLIRMDKDTKFGHLVLYNSDKEPRISGKGGRISNDNLYAERGDYKNDGLTKGAAAFKDSESQIYAYFEGSFHEGKPKNGTMYYAEGFRFEGEFKNGLPAVGTIFYADGSKFEGRLLPSTVSRRHEPLRDVGTYYPQNSEFFRRYYGKYDKNNNPSAGNLFYTDEYRFVGSVSNDFKPKERGSLEFWSEPSKNWSSIPLLTNIQWSNGMPETNRYIGVHFFVEQKCALALEDRELLDKPSSDGESAQRSSSSRGLNIQRRSVNDGAATICAFSERGERLKDNDDFVKHKYAVSWQLGPTQAGRYSEIPEFLKLSEGSSYSQHEVSYGRFQRFNKSWSVLVEGARYTKAEFNYGTFDGITSNLLSGLKFEPGGKLTVVGELESK